MYFNCPHHPPNYRKFKLLYIRRLGFQFQKDDFITSKSGNAYSEREFSVLINKIHEHTSEFVIYYRILTITYILSWIFFLLLLFLQFGTGKIYCVFPIFIVILVALCLIRAKDYYLKLLKNLIFEENEKLIKKSNMKWILGPSASFLQLFYMDDEKIPLNL